MKSYSFDLDRLRAACPCGRPHPLHVEKLWLEPGAICHLPSLLAEEGWRHPVLLCDENTFAAAGEAVLRLIPSAAVVQLSSVRLHADEHGVSAAEALFPEQMDVLIALGSGTIHDITRYHAFYKHLPFLSIPTATSVDGFVSTVAAMTWEGCKRTFPAVSPRFVLADSDLFSQAPRRLTASGFGDLLGKYTALVDWKAAHLLTGEHFCPTIYQLTMDAVNAAVSSRKGLAAGDPESCSDLLYGLLLSGLAMQMMGNSRPASGGEHHISHFWEMGIAAPPPDAYHGEKVGVGLLLCAKAYHSFAALLASGQGQAVDATGLTARELKAGISDPFLYQGLVQENTPDPLASVSGQQLLAHASDLVPIYQALPQEPVLREILLDGGCKTTVEELGLSPAILPATVTYSPYVRARLTTMRLRKLIH